MQLAIFSSTSEAGFAHDWAEEKVLALFGSATLDLTLHPPLSDTTLAVAAVFGEVKIIVPPGARVITRAAVLFGQSRVRVEPGVGPELRVNVLVLFGQVNIVEGKARAMAATGGGQTFPY